MQSVGKIPQKSNSVPNSITITMSKVLPIKLKSNSNGGVNIVGWAFYCPGCGFSHSFNVVARTGVKSVWTFNGNPDNPTFSPSLICTYPWKGKPDQTCHLFVKEGRIQYRNDCTHELAGKTIEMEDEDC